MLGSIVFSVFGFSSKVSATGLPVVDASANVSLGIISGQTSKETVETVRQTLIEVGKQILRSIAKRVLARLTRDTVNWINGGFDGKPLFLQDPQGFFVDLRNQEIKNLVNTIGYDPINYPFGRDIAIGIIQGTKNYFAQNAKYSLDQVIGGDQNRVEFQTNFSLGGWGAYTALAQPNNNRFGSQLLAKRYETKITAGLNVDAGALLKAELDQGKGFLSPKKCADPTDYDPEPFTWDGGNGTSEDYNDAYAQYQASNAVCRRWEVTTPGGLVSDQISLALGSKYRQSELGQAMGNSLSAIFDALLNKLVDDGLSALGDAGGLPVQQDNFNYLGYTLGTGNGASGTGSAWSTDDIVIDLTEFRKEISNIAPTEPPGGLERLNQALIYEEQITQELRSMPTDIRNLDICIPGPDRFWQKRLDREFQREVKKLEKKAESKNPKKSQKAIRALRALEYSIEEFKNYVTNYMISELPNSPEYMDELNNFKDISGEISRSTEQRLKYKTLIAKTTSIKNSINNPSFNTTPLTSNQEAIIKNEYKRYIALRTSIPSEEEVDQKELELNKIQENRTRIQGLTDECIQARPLKNWNPPSTSGNASVITSSGYDSSGVAIYPTEKQAFCEYPITGGYSYGDASEGTDSDNSQASDGSLFQGEDADEGDGTVYDENDKDTYILVGTHLQGDGNGYDIPIVNAAHVYKRFLTNVNIDISCNFVFPATLLDYMSDGTGVY